MWGWRFSLGFAIIPALMFLAGAIIAPDSPNSLLLNGNPERARRVSSSPLLAGSPENAMSYKRHCCLQVSLAGQDMEKLQCLQLVKGWLHQ